MNTSTFFAKIKVMLIIIYVSLLCWCDFVTIRQKKTTHKLYTRFGKFGFGIIFSFFISINKAPNLDLEQSSDHQKQILKQSPKQ